MKAPDISVIIPCFNRIALLKETLHSVEAAISRLSAEIVLVDDGSEPPLAEQLLEFNHLPLVILRQKNAGLTTARYNGLKIARGEYIQFLDSDDQIAPEKLELQLARMLASGADVSHTDIIDLWVGKVDEKTATGPVKKVPHHENPAVFYIQVQPVPHSPVFKRSYIAGALMAPFIPLTRDYDSIGEVWFYYNLSIYPAKIIKIDEPLTVVVHHHQGRLTDHWELMGLCALKLMYQFECHYTSSAPYSEIARNRVAAAAFSTFRGLPRNMNTAFQHAFLAQWKRLGKTSTSELLGGKYFKFLAALVGPVYAAKAFQGLNMKDYRQIRTLTDEELEPRIAAVLKEISRR